MAQCFVISPIGEAGSPVREHADNVWRFIIEPALTSVGMKGYRSDHTVETGEITEQIYEAILNETFCIAVMTYHNPNVFYELAIAHSAGRPVILMIERGTKIPFDLSGQRVIEYEMRPQLLVDGEYADKLRAAIESLRKADFKAKPPLGSIVNAAAAPASAEILTPAIEHFRSEDWIKLLDRVKSQFYLCGYGFISWPIMRHAREGLESAAKRGCDMRVMTYCVSNPAFSHVMSEERMASDVASLGAAFETTRAFFRKAIGSEHAVRPIKRGVIFQQLVFADDELIVIPYLFSADTGQGSLIRCKAGSSLYDSFKYEFDALWTLNGPTQTGGD